MQHLSTASETLSLKRGSSLNDSLHNSFTCCNNIRKIGIYNKSVPWLFFYKFDELSGKFPYCKYEVISQTVEEVQFSFRDSFFILTSVVK